MELSVIILNYKVPFHLMLCLESVTKALQNLEAEIIVVDNHSEDQSLTWVKQYFSTVLILPLQNNAGFSKANNQGVSLARGKYICLLNPDTVASEALFEQFILFAENHDDFGILGPKMIEGAGRFLPESKRNVPRPKVALGKLLHFDKRYYSALGQSENGAVEILSGACMFMLKKRYCEVGGLDESYFMYGEDIDLSYMFLKARCRNYYLGKTMLLHFKGESTVKNSTYKKRFYGAIKIFYKKHFFHTRMSFGLINFALKIIEWNKNPRISKKKSLTDYRHYYWLGKPQNLPREVEMELEKSFTPVLPIQFLSEKTNTSFFLFDTGTIPYDQIFKMMQLQKNQQNCFRLKLKNFNFIVGSDLSSAKGEVFEY